MSTDVPKPATKRPSGARALRLEDLTDTLAQGLDAPGAVLDLLVNGMAKGQSHPELFQALHEAALREDKLADVAFAYEHVASDKRVKLLHAPLQAELFLHAATFFNEFFGDPDGAAGHAERVLSIAPGHADAFALLERILGEAGDRVRLVRLYVDGATSERDRDRQLSLLGSAATIVEAAADAHDLAIDVYQRVLRVDPEATHARDALEARYRAAGRPRDAAKLLETALLRQPEPGPEEALAIHAKLLDLYTSDLGEMQRATPHVEALLTHQPDHARALATAEALLEHKTVAARAAAALSDAYEKMGRLAEAAAMLTRELKIVRGPRRMDVQRRLAILRQDVLGDPSGALELLGPVVAAEPGDDDLRGRYVRLAFDLDQPQQAARLLARALQTCKDPAVRARVGADIGRVFLKAGDVRRAEAALQQVVEEGHDDAAVLAAARQLAELHGQAGDTKALLGALELVVKLEPDADTRNGAARRMARLCESEGVDPARAVVAWRALADSPWADEALGKLEAIYEAAGDADGAIDVIERRGRRAKDRDTSRALAFKAAELRTARPRDRAAALGAWRALIATFGPARDAHARMIPLLEQEQAWKELAWVLERDVELAEPAERAPLLARLGQLRSSHLEDPSGALEAFRMALAIDPTERSCRAAVEKLLASGDARLAAAEILEPVYRAEEPGTALLRVLETRGELAPTPDERLAALGEAVETALSGLNDAARALALAGQGLREAVTSAQGTVPAWLERVQHIAAIVADPALRAAALADAFEGHAVDSPGMLDLARAAGEALALAGDVARAVEAYRAALAFDPVSTELLQRIDELLAQGGSPGDRLALYQSALDQAAEPARRRELLHAIAALQRREMGDLTAAIETWRAALAEDPRDWAAHQALAQALAESGQSAALHAELERALELAEGERRDAVLVRLAEALAEAGAVDEALARYRSLLERTELDDATLARVDELARTQGDGTTMRTVLERRLARTDVPATRAGLLEQLGDVLASLEGPGEAAARAWLEGARIATGVGDDERGQRLYERVVAAAPDTRDAAEPLLELYARTAQWSRMPAAFTAVLRLLDVRELTALVAGFEEQAVAAGAGAVLVQMIDALLSHDATDAVRARHLLLARARALSADPAMQDDVAATYRRLIEQSDGDAGAALEAFTAFLDAAPERIDDRRWLYEWRAAHATDRVGALVAWAQAEETQFGDAASALALYARALELDADRADVIAEMARLQAAAGDADGALASLSALRDRSEGDARASAELAIAGLLLGELGRPLDALDVLEPLVDAAPGDGAVLRLVHDALGHPTSRARAASVLERAAQAVDDPAARTRVIETLLEVSADTPELGEARLRWIKQLLESRSDDPEGALAIALQGALEAPADDEMWDAAERLARQLDRPRPVADAYAQALGGSLEPGSAEELGRRMIDFQEEWFDEPARVVELLGRIVELSPGADWAFERLKLAFNAAGRWTELFELYDRAIERAAEDDPVRLDILREAAMAAKDFASDTDRAIDYLERLDAASPGDARIDTSLERLYERDGRLRPLIDLLSRRLDGTNADAQGELRARIASLWIDLGEALPAFELIDAIVAAQGASPATVDLLERLVALPASRDSMAPTSGAKRRKRNYSIRDRAASRLREHYDGTGRTADMARMLEIELEVAHTDKERIQRLESLVKLRLESLGDEAGAFENLAALVRLAPHDDSVRSRFADLAGRTGDQGRRAQLLVLVARAAEDVALRRTLLAEAATVYEHALGDPSSAAELHAEVLELAADDRALALASARALDALLEASSRAAERCTVLERRADLEDEPSGRRAALAEAARVAAEELGDLGRATRAWRLCLADDPDDAGALDGLCASLQAGQRWEDLVEALGTRAAKRDDAERARADRVRVATIQADQLGDPTAAIETWHAIREQFGKDEESFEALVLLLGRTEGWTDLAALLSDEAAAESDAARRTALQKRLGEVHRDRRGDVMAAIAAFVSADDWASAADVAGRVPDKELAKQAVSSLLDLAVEHWKDTNEEPEAATGLPANAAQTADWALTELTARLLEEGRHADVVELSLRGAGLPFSLRRRRELARDAACLCSDRLEDAARAISIFRELFAEDPGDEIAAASVTRLALLLEEAGLDGEIASLWEQQAACREAGGDRAAAAALWARAAELVEERLDDVERALADHRHGAGLGGEASLEALARIHTARGESRAAAEVLEWLCAQSSRDALAERALRLAEAYIAAGMRKRARARLEQYAGVALDATPLRRRLADLYREMEDWTALAGLLAAEAARAPDAKARLALLSEAAGLHLDKRDDPTSAVPLLEQAVELDQDAPELRLALSGALGRAGRFDEASAILRQQIERYGARKPKDRAVVHFALARVSLAAGRRAEALAELDVASRIDPAHPGILQALARLAFEEGQLERAERMYRALLLVLGRVTNADAPSRADALLDLSEIAARQDDAVRASEFIESAFESALENPKEALALELALKQRGRHELLARALQARLSGDVPPREAARVLADLAMIHAERGESVADVQHDLQRRVRQVEADLESQAEPDDAAWAALGRVYDWLGDADAEARVLERRVAGWTLDDTATPDPDALYRLAAVKMGDPATREQGAELLERALDLHADPERAERLVVDAVDENPDSERLIRLLERVGRAPGRERILARALSLLVRIPSARSPATREGVELARSLGEPELVESILSNALEDDAAGLSDADAAWTRLELAKLLDERGDVAGALALRERAARDLPVGEARELLLSVARDATGRLEDDARAIAVYESLLEREPADREVWQPLLDLLARSGNQDRLFELIEQTVPLVEVATDRAGLRALQANMLVEQGRTDEATQVLEDVLLEDPGHVEAAMQLAGILERSGRQEELTALLVTQLDAAKDRQDVASIGSLSMRLGALLEQQDRKNDAFDIYQALLDWDKAHRDGARALLRLAEGRDDAFVLADAIENVLRSADAEEAPALAARLSALRAEQNDIEGAARALELGYQAAPTDAELRDQLVNRYAENGDWSGVARVLRVAVAATPTDRGLVERLVEAHRQAGEHDLALELLDSLAQDDGDPALLHERAQLLGELGREEEALATLEQAYVAGGDYASELVEMLERASARAQPPDDRVLGFRLVEILQQSGDIDGARARLTELVRENGKDSDALRRLADLELGIGDFNAAGSTLRRLIALVDGEQLVRVAIELADACARAERFADARSGLERALKAVPDNVEVRLWLRRLYEITGENRELARMLLEEAAAATEVADRLEALLGAGGLLLSPDGDALQAIAVLEEARTLSPESVDGVVLLARAYAAAGRGDEGMTLLTEMAQLHRGRRVKALAAVYQEMSRIQLEEGFLTDALESLSRAFDMDMKNCVLALSLGQLALDMDEDEAASRAFRAVSMMKPYDEATGEGATDEYKAEAHFQLARVAMKQGDPRKAKVLLGKTLVENPGHAQALALMEQLG